MANVFPFLLLPKDIQLLILHKMHIEDQVQFCKTCKATRELCKTITKIPQEYHSKLTNQTLQFYTNITKLDLGDTLHGEGAPLKPGWTSIALDETDKFFGESIFEG